MGGFVSFLRRSHFCLASVLVGLLLCSRPVGACTTFLLRCERQLRVCKSYDWENGHGLVMVNKRGMSKRAFFPLAPLGLPAAWVSRFGSVTFNQYGREFPQGGMNEKGLVVEIMQFLGSRYSAPGR